MAYARTSNRLLAASMVINANPDLLPDGQCQYLENVDVTAQGNFRSRLGSALIESLGGAVLQILPANGHRYALAGALYRDSSAIDSAGIANSIASFQGYVWNIATGKKDNGSAPPMWDWLPSPPTTIVTGTPSNVLGTVIAGVGAAWVPDAGEGGMLGPATGPVSDGFELQLVGDSTYMATLGGSFDLSDFHVYDKVRFMLWFKQVKDVGALGSTSGVTVQIDCNTGDFTTDFFSCELPRQLFKGLAPREWIQVPVKMAPDPAFPSAPFFTRIGNTPNKGFNTCAAIRVIFDANANTKVKIGQIDAVGGLNAKQGGLMEDKAIQYYTTFTSKDGHESNPSPVSAFIAADRQAIDLKDLPVSTDPQVINGGGIWLYRTDSTIGGVYRVTSKFLPYGTTTYHDDNNDDDLTSLGVQMVTDNNNPPSATGLAGPYQMRLLAWGGTKASRLYWSKQLMPYAFSNPDGANGAWVDVGDDGDAIVAITVRPEVCFIYKGFNIFYMSGDPGPGNGGNVQQTNAQMGACGPNAVCKGTNVDYFVSQGGQGVFQFNSDTATKISAAIDPIFHGVTVTLPSGNVIQPVQSWSTIALGFIGTTLRLSYDQTALTWSSDTGAWSADSRVATAYYADTQMLAGLAGGNIVAYDQGVQDNGQTIQCVYEKSWDAGLPDTQKTWQDLTIQWNGLGQLIAEVFYGTLYEIAGQLSQTFTQGGREVLAITTDPLAPVRAELITVRLTIQATAEFECSGLWWNYYPHAREGKTHDTSSQDFGTPMMKRCREMWIELESFDGPLLAQLLTDQPGGGMAVRDSQSVPGGTRRLEHIVWAQDFVGYLVRFYINGPDLNVFSIRALIQPIGTFLLGSRGEFWSSDALDDNVQFVKMHKWIEVVYASDSSASLTFETDEPGGVLSVKATFILPSTDASPLTENDEETIRLLLPDNIKGRLKRIRVTPQGDLRLEAIRSYTKIMGVTGTSPWDWTPFPVQPTQDAVWQPVPHPVDQLA